MRDNEKIIAKWQVVHTSLVALGATFLAVGITFFALSLNTIMTGSEIFTSNEMQHLIDKFDSYFVFFLILGGIIMFGSTVLFFVAIHRLKTN